MTSESRLFALICGVQEDPLKHGHGNRLTTSCRSRAADPILHAQQANDCGVLYVTSGGGYKSFMAEAIVIE